MMKFDVPLQIGRELLEKAKRLHNLADRAEGWQESPVSYALRYAKSYMPEDVYMRWDKYLQDALATDHGLFCIAFVEFLQAVDTHIANLNPPELTWKQKLAQQIVKVFKL